MSEVTNVPGDECWGDECRTIAGITSRASCDPKNQIIIESASVMTCRLPISEPALRQAAAV